MLLPIFQQLHLALRIYPVDLFRDQLDRYGEVDKVISNWSKTISKLDPKTTVLINADEPGLTKLKNAFKGKIEQFGKKDLKNITKSKFLNHKSLIVAYEPVWAISTNKNSNADTPENALEMIKFIKQFCYSQFAIRNLPVLYGGSVTSQNAKSFLQYKEIDGALVGGASLKAEEFGKIVKSVG